MARKLLIVFAVVGALLALGAPGASARHLSTLIAPTSVCPDQSDQQEPAALQERAMRCMTDFAREKIGLRPLANASDLDSSAHDKADDILRCNSFSHYACGRQFTYWMQHVGYLASRCWRAGENLAWGIGSQGDVRSIFTAWIHSPEHRANILGRFSQIGVDRSVGMLEGRRADVWIQHFGSHCGAPATSVPTRTRRPVGLSFARRAR